MKEKYDVLSIGAHPDDVEVGVGGVLIDLAQRGYRCGLVIMTQGEMGTGGSAGIRADEIDAAATILGADIIKVFDWGDTQLADSYDKRLALAQIIRDCRPRMIIAPYPHIGHGRRQSHPDHVAAGVITINASGLAALKKADLDGEPHLVTRIYHYGLPARVTPSFVVDITDHFDQLIKALKAHESQFLNPDKAKDYIESISSMARSAGLGAGCKYGQAFYSAQPILLGNVMTLANDD